MLTTRDSALRLALLGLWAAVLAGCASGPTRPQPNAAKLNAVPNPTPHALPRSPHGNPDTYTVFGRTYHVLTSARGYDRVGLASWYGPGFDGERTSSGETYDMYDMTAASKVLPLPTYVRVTNLENGRHVIVKVNDRGPFHPGRIIDLSYTAAYKLGMTQKGTALVRVRAIDAAGDASRDKAPSRPRAVAATQAPPARPSAGGTAVARAHPHPEHRAAQKTDSAGTRYVQAGAFGAIAHARKLVARLRGAGLSRAFIEPPPVSNGLYRVRVGPFAAPQRIRATQARLGLLGIAATVVAQ